MQSEGVEFLGRTEIQKTAAKFESVTRENNRLNLEQSLKDKKKN
jgi:hypothetical protein